MKRFLFALLATVILASTSLADDFIVIVFDNSGSMGEYMRSAKATRMRCAQDALIGVLSKLPDTTSVGIITFDGWIYDLAKVNRARLETAIRGCAPGGGTPLYRYIKDGADRLLKERARQLNVGYYKLLVVTDGEAADDYLNKDSKFKDGSLKPGVLKDIMGRGIVVDAIGLQMRNDHDLKNQINGNYMRGDDPSSIQQSIQKSVAEVGFKGDDKASAEAFDVVASLPDSFVKASIKGLTCFQNQPIGELPPIITTDKDGKIHELPNPANGEGSSGLGWGWWTLIIVGGASIIVFFLILIAR